MKIKPFFEQITSELLSIYESSEAQNIAFLLLENQHQITRNQLIINEREFSENEFENIKPFVKRLQNSEPIQYVLGQAHFYGLDFEVNQNVLIPRPETEELAHLIIEKHQKSTNLKILDIGTGSGCLPITLFHHLSNSEIHAVDISEKALQVAKKNATKLEANIQFHQLNILENNLALLPDFDIIVSNPPYVREVEKSKMQQNVLNFEPELALFVSDNNPLIFYNRITELASKKLKKGGSLYFEINEAFGKETVELLEKYNFKNITLQKDLQNTDRIVFGNL